MRLHTYFRMTFNGVSAILFAVSLWFLLRVHSDLALIEAIAKTDEANDQQRVTHKIPGDQVAPSAIASLQSIIDRQFSNEDAILDRLIGKYIPIQLPPDVDSRIKALEDIAAKPDKWPTDPHDADLLVAELILALKQIPPWAEEDWLPRLNRLRWSIEAIKCITASPSVSSGDIDSELSRCNDLISSRPDSAPTLVSTKLPSTLAFLKQKQHDFRKTEALKAAQSQDVRTARLNQVIDLLNAVGSDDADVIHARHLVEIELIGTQVDELFRQYEACVRMSDVSLRQFGISKVYELALDQSLQFSLKAQDERAEPVRKKVSDLVAKCEASLKDFGLQRERSHAAGLRQYQQLALSQIKNFNSELLSIQQDVDKQPRRYRVIKLDWQDIHYQRLLDAMVANLLTIDTAMLEQPVEQVYNQAYQQGWLQLRDNDKNDLAARAASVIKLSPFSEK